jgi:hypothetical protein
LIFEITGTFDLTINNKILQLIPVHSTDVALAKLITQHLILNEDVITNVPNVTVVRTPLRRLDLHAGYQWNIYVHNITSEQSVTICCPNLLKLKKDRVYTFDLLIRKTIGIRLAIEIMHENIPPSYLLCRNFIKYLIGTPAYPVSTIEIKRPSRFHYGEPKQTGIIISRLSSLKQHLPANLPMNNSECYCANFSANGCSSKDYRKDCELAPYGTEFDLVLPEWGRLDSDPLRPILASHEKSTYWAYSEFSVEKVKLNGIIGKTMSILKKEVTGKV